jgi:hypothetical protein
VTERGDGRVLIGCARGEKREVLDGVIFTRTRVHGVRQSSRRGRGAIAARQRDLKRRLLLNA